MSVASLKEAPPKMNRRVVWLVHTLCNDAFRVLKKMGFITGHSYVPNHFPHLLRWLQRNQWNAKVSLVAQWAGTDAFYWDLWLYLGKKEVFLFFVLNEATATLIDRLVKGCGAGSRILLSWVGRKKRKKKLLVEVRENVSILMFCITFLFLVKPSSFLFYS